MNDSSKNTLNDAFQSADLDDKLWMFYSKHARALMSIAVLALVLSGIAIAIVIGYHVSEKRMKSAYLEAIHGGNREDFARKYCSTPLGGTVFLELADAAYQRKEYQQAADHYQRAAAGLGKNIFGGRAAIGEGTALLHLGLTSEGEALLSKVAEEQAYPLLIRGHGLWLLGSSIYERGDQNRAKAVLHKLANSNFPDCWKDKAKILLQEIGSAL
ncbi:MAG: hypothetical protein LBB11_00105 [Puniceicoccales bacterium]|nr:hypothetical protein [Puniceicoccales bacterium]